MNHFIQLAMKVLIILYPPNQREGWDLSNIPYREILRDFALEILHVELDFAQILLDVTRGYQFLFTSDEFLLVINTDNHDGHTGLHGNVIEPLLPIRVGLAGSLGSDGQMECFATVASIHHLIYQRIAPTSIDGDSSYGTKHGSQRPEEPLLLHHKLSLSPNGGIEEFTDEEVPIAGVRATTDDIFWMVGHGHLRFPS